ncbi:MAG TPA: YncE family protein, partial [Solirubrobacteraceae bacterium]|nr:YncE family protein [Solirubrobacteraceae bacterium]
MARGLLLALLVCLAAPAGAAGRVVVVATGGPDVVLTDVSTNVVGPRIEVGGSTRAVAVAPDGSRAYVATGRRVVVIDLATRAYVGAAVLPSTVTALAVTPDGARILAGRARAIDAVDAASLQPTARIALGRATATAIAVEPTGARAAVALRRFGAGIVSLAANRLTVRRRLPHPGGVGWGNGAPWFSQRAGALTPVDPLTGRPLRRIALPGGLGGAVALSPRQDRAIVGAAGRRPQAGVVDLRSGRTLAIPTGRGPGVPSFTADGSRLYVANRGAGTVSVISGYTYRRLARQD